MLLLGSIASSAAFGQVPIRPAVDTSIYAILVYDKNVKLAMAYQFHDAQPTTLSTAEVNDMEIIIDSAYRAYNRDSSEYYHLMEPLSSYNRQYVAITNRKGQKEVWINFFCTSSGDWKHNVVDVDDGGVCFFQLTINLSLRKAYHIIPGGSA